MFRFPPPGSARARLDGAISRHRADVPRPDIGEAGAIAPIPAGMAQRERAVTSHRPGFSRPDGHGIGSASPLQMSTGTNQAAHGPCPLSARASLTTHGHRARLYFYTTWGDIVPNSKKPIVDFASSENLKKSLNPKTRGNIAELNQIDISTLSEREKLL